MTEENNKSCVTTEGKSKCCWMKCVLAIVVLTIFGNVSGMLVWGQLYKDVWSAPEFAGMWRPMDADEWKYMPAAHLLHAFFFVWVFSKVGCCVTSKCGTNFGKGMIFGVYVWFFTGLMAGVWSYIVYPISIELASAYVVQGAFTNILGGGLVGLIKGRGNQGSCATKCDASDNSDEKES